MFRKRRRGEKPGSRSDKWRNLDDLVLSNAKLKFCPDQLQNLNFIFNRRLQHKTTAASDKSVLLAKSVTERLIQRLVCGAGILDPRFSSKYLISIHNQENQNIFPTNLEYMVRLDNLSTPSLYESDTPTKYSIIEADSDYPAAYARIRLHTSSFKTWGDYTTVNEYLRRDKIQARMVELLAQAAAQETPNSPLHVDESIHCGTPGKIVDSATLHSILQIPTTRHVYYGPGGNVPRFPDPRDFRLAIVDEPGGIRLRVEFLSPALSNISINVRILVAIGLDAWPSSTDFPTRISLGHSDCLLYHQAAQTGMYLVGYGVQSSAWQIRMPAAEFVLMNNYGPNSSVRTVLDVLYDTLDEMDNLRGMKHQQVSYRILNRYILLTVLLEDLEDDSVNPPSDLINWSPLFLSTRVLKLLDKVIGKLYKEHLSNYFFKKSNLLVNPGHWCEEDFMREAMNIKNYIVRLFDESLMSTKGNQEFENMLVAQESEMMLLHRWRELVSGLLPPSSTRGRRFCFAGSKNKQQIVHTQYTARQLEYISILLKSVLNVKQSILQTDNIDFGDLPKPEHTDEDFLEDVIFIIVTIMDQARDQYLQTQTNPNVVKNKTKIRIQYSIYTSKLVDLIRRDKEILNFNFEDDLGLVKLILKWLYKAMDQNKRYLAPILRPYLHTLFSTSHSISWHVDSIKQRFNNDEISALGSFSELINSGKITPAEGLIDAVNKNWNWANHMMKMVERNTLRVIFVSDRGKVYRHILSLPSYRRENVENGTKSMGSPKDRKPVRRQKTMPNRSYFNSILKQKNDTNFEESSPQHENLKNSSSLNLILSARHRRGEHRCCGDIFKALLSMHKLNMFHEVTSTLPPEDRTEILSMIQNMQSMRSHRLSLKKWSSTLPSLRSRSRISPSVDDIQKYTQKEESAGIRIKDDKPHAKSVINLNTCNINSLIGTCRAARIREDSSVFVLQDSFKVKSLLNKSESFKY